MAAASNPHWRDGIRLTFVTLILLALVVYLFDVLLLFFAAALLAVVFRAPSEWLARHTRLDVRVALGVVLVFIAGLLALSGWLVGHTLAEEAEGIWKRLPQAIDELRGRASDIAVVGPAVENATLEGPTEGMVKNGLKTITAAFGAVANIAIVLFVGVLLAAQPDMYVRGCLHLVPKRHRRRAGEVFEEVGHMLRRWMLGQLCLMVLVGVLTWLAFWAIGLEFAGALGLIAGLLTFIPYVGSLAAGAVAVLLALSQGIDVALLAAAVYTGVQIIENVCEPFVQQRTVYLAPALLLFAQAVLGSLVGPLGIILAAPLAAVTIVVIKMLYIEDRLGDHEVMPDH
jgi:predicted PurR-regulated permease PerM